MADVIYDAVERNEIGGCRNNFLGHYCFGIASSTNEAGFSVIEQRLMGN
jgi:hypothetical protein